MTIRDLYDYVIKCIATRPEGMISHEKKPRVADETAGVGSVSTAEDPASPTAIKTETTSTSKGRAHRENVKFKATILPERTEGPSAVGKITYRERLGGYLHPRDMRRLLTPFSASNSPELMVRRHVILLNCDPVRAIILRDRALVLVPDGSEAVEKLDLKLLETLQEMKDSVFGPAAAQSERSEKTKPPEEKGKTSRFTLPGFKRHGKGNEGEQSNSNVSDASETEVTVEMDEFSQSDDEWDEIQSGGWADLPFELRALDVVLHTVAVMLADDVETLQEAVHEAVERLLESGGTGDTDQYVMRAIKNDINGMRSRVVNFIRAITTALDDEADLTLMNLSRLITHPERFIQPVSEEVLNEESDEPELILEANMQQALSTSNQLELLEGQVVTSEELMTMHMDTIRNRLLYMNTVLAALSLIVATGSLVGSIFGMNLLNGLEDEPGVFGKVVIGTLVGSALFLILAIFVFRKAGILCPGHQPRLDSTLSLKGKDEKKQ